MKRQDLQGPRQNAVHQTAASDTDATAHCIADNSSNGVQPSCCHLNAWDDCNTSTRLVKQKQLAMHGKGHALPK